MGAIEFQIISLTIVYSNVYSDADERKHQSSASLATKPALIQNRFSIKTGFASSIEATKLDLVQNGSIQNRFSIKY